MIKSNGDLLEDETHSFFVKIWLEETKEESGRAKWRGYITHILDGKRQHFESLGDMLDFIILYMKKMGIEFHSPLDRKDG